MKYFRLGLLSLLLIGCGSESSSPDSGDASPGTPMVDGSVTMPDGSVGGACGEAFLDLSDAESPADGLPPAELSVECTDDMMIVRSNGLPHYRFRQTTPNALTVQSHEFMIPLNPTTNATTTEIPLLGTVGVAINGVPFYGPNEAANLGFGDPVADEILDECLGHTGGAGDYHYHALLMECLAARAYEANEPSPIIGYALDGFPIYGPMGCTDEACTEVVEFQSSWETLGTATAAWDNNECNRASCAEADGTYLDQCNGRVGPDGTYRYHATATFPYILGCFRGTASASAGGGAPGGMMGGMMGGPAACTEESDCVGACPDGSMGCTCHNTPMGQLCVPTCTTDADCPAGMGGRMLTCNEMQGICTPGMMGG